MEAEQKLTYNITAVQKELLTKIPTKNLFTELPITDSGQLFSLFFKSAQRIFPSLSNIRSGNSNVQDGGSNYL